MFLLQNAQLGGIVSSLTDALRSGIGWFLDTIFSWLLDTVWTAIATVIYQTVIMPMLMFIDGISIVFRKFAGLGSYTSHGVVHTNSDFLYTLITNSTIMNIFWSMLILGVILLFITTFVAVIKSETTELGDSKGGNNKVKILKQTFRTILNFAIVPICAVVGIMMGNVLLRSLDQATGGENGYTGGMGNRVFVSSAYNANRVRIAIGYYEDNVDGKESKLDWTLANGLAQEFYKKDLVDLIQENRAYELADSIDELFINGYDKYAGTDSLKFQPTAMIGSVDTISRYYNIGRYNIILGVLECVGIIILLIKITLGLIKRLFTVVSLFVCAPPIVAISPLNPGILKEWNKNFISQVIAGYGAVVGMNLFLIILGAISDIQFISAEEIGIGTAAGLLNSIIMILVMVAGLVFVKDLIGMLSKMIGGDDALAAGTNVTKSVASAVGAAVGIATGTVALRKANSAMKHGLGEQTKKKDEAKARMKQAIKDNNFAAYDQAKADFGDAIKKEDEYKDNVKNAKKGIKSNAIGMGDALGGDGMIKSLAGSVVTTKANGDYDKNRKKWKAQDKETRKNGPNLRERAKNSVNKSKDEFKSNIDEMKTSVEDVATSAKNVAVKTASVVKAGGVKLAETAKDVVEGTKQQAGIVKAYYTPEVEKMKRNFTKLRGRIEFNRALNSAKYYKTKEIKPNQTVEVVDMKSFELKGFDENDFKSKSGTNYHDIPKEKRDKTVKRKINQRKKK